jgi:hypothetical protein
VASRPNGGMVRTIRRDFIRTPEAQYGFNDQEECP